MVLPLRGPAHATVAGVPLALRSKGLALLYYLAIEGSAWRDHLSELLWGHGDALGNLRVELHRLKQELEPHGITPFRDRADPLHPTQVVLDRAWRPAAVMEGLDDLSPAFQEWLDRQRLLDPGASPDNPRQDLVDSVAAVIELPFVLVLAGEPGSGRPEFAKDLARRLEIPFVAGCGGRAPALNYVSEDDDCAETVSLGRDERLWVLERSRFGEEPELLLRLRAGTPPDRMRYVTLGHLRWWETKRLLPRGLPFEIGSALHLASAGNLHYLRELLELYDEASPHVPLPVPLKVRAAFLLEARRLSPAARRALETASVHPGPLSAELASALAIEPHLEELERNGWLHYAEHGWSFSSELARRLFACEVPQGTRARIDGVVRAALATEGSRSGAPGRSGLQALGPVNERREDRLAPEEPEALVVPGPEAWIGEVAAHGAGVTHDGRRIMWSQTGEVVEPARVRLELSGGPLLVRVKGKVNLSAWATGSRATSEGALTMSSSARGARPVTFRQPGERAVEAEGALRLPLTPRFDHWFLLPAADELRFASDLANAVVELRVITYEPVGPQAVQGGVVPAVRAYSLSGQADEEHGRPPTMALHAAIAGT